MGAVADQSANGAHDHVPFAGGLPLFFLTIHWGIRSFTAPDMARRCTSEPQTEDSWDGKPRLILRVMRALSAA